MGDTLMECQLDVCAIDSIVMDNTYAKSTVAHQQQQQLNSGQRLKKSKDQRMKLEKVGFYKVGQTLGRGNFATVRVAYHETANAKVAMKIVDRSTLDAENMAKIEREVEILQNLCHPYIIRLYEIIRTERYLYIITEYVSNGELFDMLINKGRQTEDESRRLFQQIASAVFYCHSHGIVHRDLKAENLLIDKKGNIKLIDFGFSNYQRAGQTLATWCGSPPYAAPELLLAQAYDGRLSDVWSLGVILYILVTAGFPFPGESVDKLKRAVLSDHLKIPFWVSVECADLIRKMLTVSPAKRCTMQNVVQHRWFTCKMPDDIRQLVNEVLYFSPSNTSEQAKQQQASISSRQRQQRQLDPTVVVFMQQHTGWTEEQISEDVISRNYFSPIFATYELLLAKLNELKQLENSAVAANGSSTSGSNSSTLRLDNDPHRRGSRGSILSGKANVDVEQQSAATMIPAHHLAKLSLTTTPDYDSDDSSASDLSSSLSPSSTYSQPIKQQQLVSKQHQQQTYASGGSTSYKARRRRCLQAALQDRQQQQQQHVRTPHNNLHAPHLNEDVNGQNRRHTLCAAAADTTPLNPLLSAAAQQFSVDTRAWANAAAAAALFATQLYRQQAQPQLLQQQELSRQQQLQHAALNLVSLQNFPLDYARMINVSNQERRASANEALLGLNSYAHLLAACSTMGISAAAAAVAATERPLNAQSVAVGNVGCSNSVAAAAVGATNSNSPTRARQHSSSDQRRSVEEEGEQYLNNRGASKRNTVHAGMSQAINAFYVNSSLPRHARTPYSKQNSVIMSASTGGGSCGNVERRSSWASSTATTAISGLNISAQQHAQLERLYRQSIGAVAGGTNGNGGASTGSSAPQSSSTAAGGPSTFHPSDSLTGVQQLQMEFQKLCASTTSKGAKHFGTLQHRSSGHLPISSSYNVINSLLDGQMKAPTISITDENNQSLTSPTSASASFNPMSFLSQQNTTKIGSNFSGASSSITDHQHNQQQQQQQQQQSSQREPRPATVIGFSSAAGGGGLGSSSLTGGTVSISASLPSTSGSVEGFAGPTSAHTSPSKTTGGVKFLYVPVSTIVALERLERFVTSSTEESNIRYEAQPISAEDGTDDEAMRIRVTPDEGRTILELTLFRMPQSPNISKAMFTMVQGEVTVYEQLRSGLLSVFNEVY